VFHSIGQCVVEPGGSSGDDGFAALAPSLRLLVGLFGVLVPLDGGRELGGLLTP